MSVSPSLRHRLLVLTVLGCFLGSSSPASGFGFRAHVAATMVAERHLEPHARQAVAKLLAASKQLRLETDERTEESLTILVRELGPIESEFARASLWADLYRPLHPETGTFHYVNASLKTERYNRALDPEGVHVVSKIEEFARVLRSGRSSESEKATALLYLVHLVEDLHVPLHVASNGDKGGNEVRITYVPSTGRPLETNLHAVWDYVLFQSEDADLKSTYERITSLDTPENRQQWMRGEPSDWANESIALAKKAYRHPTADRLIRSGDSLGAKYREKHLPAAAERACQAGLRLAKLLNESFPQD